MFKCQFCEREFSRKFNKDRHEATHTPGGGRVFECRICKKPFRMIKYLQKHRLKHAPQTRFKRHKSAFRQNCVIYRKIHPHGIKSIYDIYRQDKSDIRRLLRYFIATRNHIKCAIAYHAEFLKYDVDGQVIDMDEICIRRNDATLTKLEDVRDFLISCREHAEMRIEDFTQSGSGWQLNDILGTDLLVSNCPPLNGACSPLTISSEAQLKKIKSDARNEGNACFVEAVASSLANSVDSKVIQDFIIKNIQVNIDLPALVKDIPKFERHNSHLNFRVNVIREEGGKLFPYHRSKGSGKKVINLLLFRTLFRKKRRHHYALITDIDKFLRRVYKGANNRTEYEKSYHCINCLCKFGSRHAKMMHTQDCNDVGSSKVKVPPKNSFVYFDKYLTQFKIPIIGFFDFESIQSKNEFECMRCMSNECMHRTKTEATHEPICYSLILLTRKGKILYQNQYFGKDCAFMLVKELLDLEPLLHAEIMENIPMKISDEEQECFDKATYCHICMKKFEDGTKVRDHNHLSGRYMGAAHSNCNLNRKEPRRIKLFAHNLQGYDSHLILNHLRSDDRIVSIRGLANNMQKMKTFSINSYDFIDSFAFMPTSLDSMVSNLGSDHKFRILHQSGLTRGKASTRKLLMKKGIFPYEYIESEQELEATSLPPKENFFSKLTNSQISDDDYAHAQQVFKELKCKTLKEYCMAYCHLDVCLLAEVVLQFRKEIHDEVKIDCCHFMSLPQLSFQMMLKKTGVQLELLSDIDQILMIEKSIRGGNSFVSRRYAEANLHPSKGELYAEIAYIDANNLYGMSSCLPMPTSNFRWLTGEEIEELNILSLSDADETGYILEVDLTYPKKLHKAHNDFPLAPEKRIVTHDMASDYAKGK
jgi:hypothetical protein